MSIFRKAKNGQDVDVSDEDGLSSASGKNLELLYEKLFPKIGRDFVAWEDFERIMIVVLEHIDPEIIEEIDFSSKESAIERAFEYKEFMLKDIDGSKIYEDLIDLSED